MPRKGQKSGPKYMNLTLFGRYVKTLSDLCGVNQMDLAEMTGLSQSTISKATREGSRAYSSRASGETVELLWQAFARLAEQHHLTGLLIPGIQESFFSSVDPRYPPQKRLAELRLAALEAYVGSVNRIQKMDAHKTDLLMGACVATIFELESRIMEMQNEIAILKQHIQEEEQETTADLLE